VHAPFNKRTYACEQARAKHTHTSKHACATPSRACPAGFNRAAGLAALGELEAAEAAVKAAYKQGECCGLSRVVVAAVLLVPPRGPVRCTIYPAIRAAAANPARPQTSRHLHNACTGEEALLDEELTEEEVLGELAPLTVLLSFILICTTRSGAAVDRLQPLIAGELPQREVAALAANNWAVACFNTGARGRRARVVPKQGVHTAPGARAHARTHAHMHVHAKHTRPRSAAASPAPRAGSCGRGRARRAHADHQAKGFFGRSIRKLESLLDKQGGSGGAGGNSSGSVASAAASLALDPDLSSRLSSEQHQLLHLNHALLYYLSGGCEK
jgi:hypothetical protein